MRPSRKDDSRAQKSVLSQFSRSCVGGSTVLPFPSESSGVLPSCIVDNKESANENDILLVTEALRPRENSTDLRFESRFESGNLGKVVKITDTYYQLYLRRDLYTPRHTQWYYFRVSNTRSRITYRYDCELELQEFDDPNDFLENRGSSNESIQEVQEKFICTIELSFHHFSPSLSFISCIFLNIFYILYLHKKYSFVILLFFMLKLVRFRHAIQSS